MYVKYLYLFLFPETYCRCMYFCSMVFSLVLFLLHVCAVITLQRLYCTLEQSPSKSSSIYIQYRDSSLRDNATRCFTSLIFLFSLIAPSLRPFLVSCYTLTLTALTTTFFSITNLTHYIYDLDLCM